MKKIPTLVTVLWLALSVVFATSAFAQSLDVDSSSYAAIAYSPETGSYGYSYSFHSRASAERAALDHCDASDAQIVCWVNRGFCALALGDDKSCWGTGWSYDDGAASADAKDRALAQCSGRTTGARVVLCLVSDGQYIFER